VQGGGGKENALQGDSEQGDTEGVPRRYDRGDLTNGKKKRMVLVRIWGDELSLPYQSHSKLAFSAS